MVFRIDGKVVEERCICGMYPCACERNYPERKAGGCEACAGVWGYEREAVFRGGVWVHLATEELRKENERMMESGGPLSVEWWECERVREDGARGMET